LPIAVRFKYNPPVTSSLGGYAVEFVLGKGLKWNNKYKADERNKKWSFHFLFGLIVVKNKLALEVLRYEIKD
jgi:hypothetical protein